MLLGLDSSISITQNEEARFLNENVFLSGQGHPDALANAVSAHLNRNPAFINITFLFKY